MTNPSDQSVQDYKNMLLDLCDEKHNMELAGITGEALQEIENLIRSVKGILKMMIGETEFKEWAFYAQWKSGDFEDSE